MKRDLIYILFLLIFGSIIAQDKKNNSNIQPIEIVNNIQNEQIKVNVIIPTMDVIFRITNKNSKNLENFTLKRSFKKIEYNQKVTISPSDIITALISELQRQNASEKIDRQQMLQTFDVMVSEIDIPYFSYIGQKNEGQLRFDPLIKKFDKNESARFIINPKVCALQDLTQDQQTWGVIKGTWCLNIDNPK